MDKQVQVKLVIRRATVFASLQWLQQSWQLFKEKPAVWIQMFVVTAILSILAPVHPLFTVAGFLLSPFLTAGWYKTIVAVQQKQEVSFSWLFKPLAEVECRAVLLRLAAASMLISIPLSMMLSGLVEQIKADALQTIHVFIFSICYALVWMFFAYAVAIAYFLKERRIMMILQASFIACWRNIQTLAVFGLLAVLLIALTIPTLFLAMLIVMPVLNIAFFLSFNEFFALQFKGDADAVLEV